MSVKKVNKTTGATAKVAGLVNSAKIDEMYGAFPSDASASNKLVSDATANEKISDAIADKADKVSSATNGNFAGLNASGNLTDSGKKASDFATPTDIQNLYADNGLLGAKNLLPNIGASNTINGITYTVNEDGSVTADGTATSNSEFILIQYQSDIATEFKQNIIGKTLTLSGCPNGGGSSKYHVRKWGQGSSGTYYDQGNGVTFTPTLEEYDSYTWNFQIRIMSGTTVSNLLFKPMLRLASDTDNTYQPYAKTNQQLTKDKAEQAEVNDIVNVYGSKNLLPFNVADIIAANTNGTWSGNNYTIKGVTFTLNDDGSVTVNGTHDGTSGVATLNLLRETAWTHPIEKITGAPSGSAQNYCALEVYNHTTSTRLGYVSETNPEITIPDTVTNIGLYIHVWSGQTVSNLTFYPMLRLASDPDDTYQPYAKTNQELTEDSVDWNNFSKLGAVNDLSQPWETSAGTINDVTFSVNADGSISASGTATADTSFYLRLSANPYHANNTKKFTCNPSGGSTSTYYTRVYDKTLNMDIANDVGDGGVILQSGHDFTFIITIKNGYTINQTFYPMIAPVDHNGGYVPYAKTNKELTEIAEILADKGFLNVPNGGNAPNINPDNHKTVGLWQYNFNNVDYYGFSFIFNKDWVCQIRTQTRGTYLQYRIFNNTSWSEWKYLGDCTHRIYRGATGVSETAKSKTFEVRDGYIYHVYGYYSTNYTHKMFTWYSSVVREFDLEQSGTVDCCPVSIDGQNVTVSSAAQRYAQIQVFETQGAWSGESN